VRPRSRAAAFLVALGILLLLASAAAAADGGFGPPTPRTPNASRINDAYWYIFGFAAFIFVLVEVALVVFVVRFRSRGRSRDVEGPQIRGNTNLEVAWTVGPVLILAAIAAFIFYKLPGIKNVPPASAGSAQIRVKVEAHQFYWQFDYPGGAISIDRLVVPVNQVVRLDVVSPDVAHSWWVPSLGGKIDAIPGRTNHTWFKIARPGTYQGQCAEFCGVQHAKMTAQVEAVSSSDYRSFLASHAPKSTALGEEIVTGVCAKCHGLSGQGGVGPAIAGSGTIGSRTGLIDAIKHGRPPARTVTGMPAVGQTWGTDELNAAVAAIQKRWGTGGTSGS
jgi:cytochrome c oxidase subunit II